MTSLLAIGKEQRYIGALPCGCVVHLWVADGSDPVWEAEAYLNALKAGEVVSVVSKEEAAAAHLRFITEGCPHRDRQLALTLEAT